MKQGWEYFKQFKAKKNPTVKRSLHVTSFNQYMTY